MSSGEARPRAVRPGRSPRPTPTTARPGAPTAHRTSTRPRRARRGGSVVCSGPCAAAAPRGSPPGRAPTARPSAGSSRRPGAPRRPPGRSPRPPRGRPPRWATRPGRAHHRAGSTGRVPRCGPPAGSAAAGPRATTTAYAATRWCGSTPTRSASVSPGPSGPSGGSTGSAGSTTYRSTRSPSTPSTASTVPAPPAGGQLHRRVLPVPEHQAGDDAPVVAAEDGDHATSAPARRYSASVAASTPLQSCAGGVSSR